MSVSVSLYPLSPLLPVPNKPYGFYGREAPCLQTYRAELGFRETGLSAQCHRQSLKLRHHSFPTFYARVHEDTELIIQSLSLAGVQNVGQ